MKSLCIAILLIVINSAGASSAEDLFDDTEKIEGMTIAYAGLIEKIDCPREFSYGYDCSEWPLDFYKFQDKNVCFQASLYVCGHSCNGMLAVDKSDKISLFVIERNFDGVLKQATVTLYKCPRGVH